MRRALLWRAKLLVIGLILISGAVSSFAQDTPSRLPLPHNPAHSDQPIGWCAYHMGRREHVAALSDCDYAVARDPRSVAALSNRGSVYLLAGEPSRAIVDFDAAIALVPDNADLFFNRGIAHSQMGARTLAIADYTKAISLKPELAIAYHNRGYEFERLSRLGDALADYRRALALQPELRQSADAVQRLSGESY